MPYINIRLKDHFILAKLAVLVFAALNGPIMAQTVQEDSTTRLRPASLGHWQPIPEAVWQAMRGRSWHPHLPCPKRSELALLSIPYRDFNGQRQIGQMIVARDVADDVLQAFAMIFEAGFAIAKMQLIHHYDGDDSRSMAANNTSAFNCRRVSGGRRMSQHSFGRAIDINPIQNPFVRRGRVQPAAGRPFAHPSIRKRPIPGLIRRGDSVTTAFRRIGWKWGGLWRHSKDYQHFSQSGR